MGPTEGPWVGPSVGPWVGPAVGPWVGAFVGFSGADVGAALGSSGPAVGCSVGAANADQAKETTKTVTRRRAILLKLCNGINAVILP